jgi:hypothetical protein
MQYITLNGKKWMVINRPFNINPGLPDYLEYVRQACLALEQAVRGENVPFETLGERVTDCRDNNYWREYHGYGPEDEQEEEKDYGLEEDPYGEIERENCHCLEF